MKEVADVLKVTPRTVAFHKYRVMEELNIRTTAELIQFAIKIKNIGSVKSARESRNKAWRFNHSLNAASLTLCF